MKEDAMLTVDDSAAAIVVADVPPAVDNYGGDSVEVYRDTAHIRQRPDMYIGDTGTKGLHHLVNELVANSLDEALAGFCKNINIRIAGDGSLSVSDDGRGIPVEEHPEEKKSTLEVVMTTVGAGAKFGKSTYRVSAGLHGMGAKAVTALSEWAEARIHRGGRVYTQEYERGKATTAVKDIGPSQRTGTTITFKPDAEVFHDLTFEYDMLEGRLRELAYLNKGLSISLTDERIPKEEVFKYDGGLAQFVQYVNRLDDALHPPIYFEKQADDVVVEAAMQYTGGEADRFLCYANNAFNIEGGTHLSGFRNALTRTVGAYGTREQLFKNVTPEGKDFREGLTLILSVKVPEPKFNSQEKRKLTNPEVEGIVAGVVTELLGKYLEEHPKEAQRIARKVATAAEAREAAAKARKALIDRKKILSGGGLPGKLFDCTTRDRDESELFLVEGDSAGGSAEAGRDRKYQAVLPLRGKPLNVEKARFENLLKNEEISSLISAIGMDIGNEEEYEAVKKRLRYGKIIILTDADVDGQHIRTLLLTFFYRQMLHLVAEGHIYVARPPLYKVTQRKQVRFVQTAEQMHRELMERGLAGTKLSLLPRPTAAAGTVAKVIEGEGLAALLKLLARIEESLVTLERSGLNILVFLARATERGLPTYRVTLLGREHWFYTPEEVETFRRSEVVRLKREVQIGEESPLHATGAAAPVPNGTVVETMFLHEMHEVRRLNRALEELRRQHLHAADLLPSPQVAGREPPPRYTLENDERQVNLSHLRDLLQEVRRIGERGMVVTRFKGLGEMDGDELWDTTLDPEKRILLQVKLEDVLKAEEMFRTLMGEKVEPRRDFIVEHALRAKDIDYHGA